MPLASMSIARFFGLWFYADTMHRTRNGIIIGILWFFSSASVASASITILSNSPTYSNQPFSFYCDPYKYSFESGKHYTPTDGGPCVFSIPYSPTGQRLIAVYKGVPGNAVFIGGDAVLSNNPSLVQEDSLNFGIPQQDQDYFAAVWDLSLFGGSAGALGKALSTGTPLPSNAVLGQNYYTLQWKWGSKSASEFDPVLIVPGILGSWQKNGDWVIDPILHSYDNLINTFLANGYVQNKTLFTFPYDWERSNRTTADLLANKIQSIKTICGCQHVDLVTHSMGGLVALSYIESSSYKNDVDQLFMITPPLSGAPKAYKAWEAGELDFGGNVQNTYMSAKFTREAKKNGFGNIFDYIQHGPVDSIYELLPVNSNYLLTATSSLVYPNSYPVNGFLETILANIAQVYKKVQVKTILADTKTDSTITGYIVKPSTQLPKWEHGEPTKTIFGAGDGIVPRTSIENIVGPADKELDNVDHSGAASSSASFIFSGLNGKDPNPFVSKNYSPNVGLLLITLLSPIDMQIIAPDGKRLGKDFTTNTEINEMPDAFYSGFNTDDEYAAIVDPLPGTYQVKTIGTGGGGEYTIVTDYVTSTTSTEAQVTGSTSPAQTIDHSIFLSSTSSVITITKNIPPPTLTPDSCLTDIATAYQKKWITKKALYDELIFDCKALKTLFKTRDDVEKISPIQRTKTQNALLSATIFGIKLVLDHMDLLAKDKTNTADAVLLIRTYTACFRK